jgi:hypothetical protein
MPGFQIPVVINFSKLIKPTGYIVTYKKESYHSTVVGTMVLAVAEKEADNRLQNDDFTSRRKTAMVIRWKYNRGR